MANDQAFSLLLFGATRGTGLALAALARAHGLAVVALARSGADTASLQALGCVVEEGDVLDAARVRAVVAAHPDARAVSTLGGGPLGASADHQGVVNVVDALTATGPRRLVLVTSLGVGESRVYASPRLIDAIGPVLDEKGRGEAYARAAGLALTVVRPGGLRDGPADGRGALYDDPQGHGWITRGELARLLLLCLNTPATEGRVLTALGQAEARLPEGVGPAFQ
ncbi:NAD(P)H-binding protein [Pararhodospirillum photometricum]|uniref:NAD-dependent epimerase/dehydratase n=1 Tax=Pararhodospirillum photometricum DSM 122 TaxID=1150469 RepID=H6SMV0_PARPM|nr:NAD(P)H-binding protein [Pararhodospirillum photometricum]CCG09235.1 NAD-dependent epimerase/dehydratase [Pararhodospirillum photometricum DSM 122]